MRRARSAMCSSVSSLQQQQAQQHLHSNKRFLLLSLCTIFLAPCNGVESVTVTPSKSGNTFGTGDSNQDDTLGYLATGLAYDVQNQQAMIIGTTFQNSAADSSETNATPNCFAALGSNSGDFLSTTLIESSVCFQGTVNLLPSKDTTNPSDFGFQSIVGVQLSQDEDLSVNSQDRTVLHSFGVGQGRVQVTSETPVPFERGTFPAAMTRTNADIASSSNQDDTALYIALHKTSFSSAFMLSSTPDLWTLLEYQMDHTDPRILSASQTPQILKKDGILGAIDFAITLATNDPALDEADQDPTSAIITDMVVKDDLLIVAGSTNTVSSKDVFGERIDDGPTASTDWDGYVVFLKIDTGDLVPDPSAIRIQSFATDDQPSNDWVRAMCMDQDQTNVYVVGTTGGIVTGIHSEGAFVFKISIETREVVWKYQLAGSTIEGTSCIVQDNSVYFGGITTVDVWSDPTFGANHDVKLTSPPRAYVASLDVTTSKPNWIRPVSGLPDILADFSSVSSIQEQLVDMDLDGQGDVLVLLNAFDLEEGTNEIVLRRAKAQTGEFQDWNLRTATPTSGKSRGAVLAIGLAVPIVLGLIIFGAAWAHQRKQFRACGKELDDTNETAVESGEALPPTKDDKTERDQRKQFRACGKELDDTNETAVESGEALPPTKDDKTEREIL